jgi:uncharacterized protein (DUF305 family)
MKTTFFRSIRIITILVLAFSVVVRPVFADAPAPEKQTAKYEIKFMEGMIDHHMMAVMMAEMCLEKAIHSELVQQCQEIIATQSQEIEMMQTWLMEWYGIEYMPDMQMGEMMGHMMMDPAQFEVWFMKKMIGHHATAIKEAETCLEKAYHPELLSMCQDIIVTQAMEIDLMQSWLCEWYGVCEYRKNL